MTRLDWDKARARDKAKRGGPVVPRRMFARYAGMCGMCGQPFKAGAAVVWDPADRGIDHARCWRNAVRPP